MAPEYAKDPSEKDSKLWLRWASTARETERTQQTNTTLELIRLYSAVCVLAARPCTTIKRPETQPDLCDARVHPPLRGDRTRSDYGNRRLGEGSGTRNKRVLKLIRLYSAHARL